MVQVAAVGITSIAVTEFRRFQHVSCWAASLCCPGHSIARSSYPMPTYRSGRHELGRNFLTDRKKVDTIVDLVSRTAGHNLTP